MKRRELLALVGSAAATWPLTVRAQQAARLPSIGLFVGPAQNDPETKRREAGFLDKFRELGWVDDRSVRIHHRWTSGSPDRFRAVAKELVELNPNVIVVLGANASAALVSETRTIPIVFASVADPVALGFVKSLSRP